MALTLSFPLRIVGGQVETVELTSAEHVAQCVEVAARCEEGWRIEAPEFGVPNPLGQIDGLDPEELRGALARSEPRAAAVVQLIDELDDARAQYVRVLIDREA